MILRCYGARGSIPVSGAEYNKYGGDTTCLEIRNKEDEILIVDAGSGIRRLGNRLFSEKRSDLNFIFTHSHLDHIMGFPFFKPLYVEKSTIQLMGCPTAQGDIKTLLSRTMSAPLFPVQFDELKATVNYSPECYLSFVVGSMEIFPINLSHPNLGMGYKFVEDGKTVVFLTDNELGYQHRGGRSFQDYADFSNGAELLIHDAQYTPLEYEATRTWGHSTYTDALELALAAGVKRLGLFHHEPDRNDTEQDEIVQKCQEIIKDRKSELGCFAMTNRTEFTSQTL